MRISLASLGLIFGNVWRTALARLSGGFFLSAALGLGRRASITALGRSKGEVGRPLIVELGADFGALRGRLLEPPPLPRPPLSLSLRGRGPRLPVPRSGGRQAARRRRGHRPRRRRRRPRRRRGPAVAGVARRGRCVGAPRARARPTRAPPKPRRSPGGPCARTHARTRPAEERTHPGTVWLIGGALYPPDRPHISRPQVHRPAEAPKLPESCRQASWRQLPMAVSKSCRKGEGGLTRLGEPRFGRSPTNSGYIWPNVARLGQAWPNFDQDLAELGEFGPSEASQL